jgi:hypothetical protein
MTPIVRWFRNLREKIFGSFFEGPTPPERLDKIVIVFANTHPNATKFDWVNFAMDHAREAYRAGWVRGYEKTERDPDEREIINNANPDIIADALNPDWRWSPEVKLEGNDEPLQDMPPNERDQLEHALRDARRKRKTPDRA